MALRTPHDGKKTSIADRCRPLVHRDVAHGNLGRRYRNFMTESRPEWHHVGPKGEDHSGEWQKCREAGCRS